MASLKERVSADGRSGCARATPWLDHTVRMVAALRRRERQRAGRRGDLLRRSCRSSRSWRSAFFVVGHRRQVYPDIRAQMVAEIDQLLPGRDRHRARARSTLDTIEHVSGTAGLVGLLGLLYAGLGWLSALRQALEVMFVVPPARAAELPGRQAARPRRRWSLVGLTLLVSVVLSGAVTGFSGAILGWLGIDRDLDRGRRCCSASSGTRWRSRRPRCCC